MQAPTSEDLSICNHSFGSHMTFRDAAPTAVKGCLFNSSESVLHQCLTLNVLYSMNPVFAGNVKEVRELIMQKVPYSWKCVNRNEGVASTTLSTANLKCVLTPFLWVAGVS